MKRKGIVLLLLLALSLSGCQMQSVRQMYRLPKRSESYMGLQSAIDSAMQGLEFSAPLSGENRQTVQMADLNGDGVPEYLLFAKGNTEKPLQILIFSEADSEYRLLAAVDCTGTSFDRVEYFQMDHRPGVEFVVSRMMSDQGMRSVSVFSLENGSVKPLVSNNCADFVCSDLDSDEIVELVLLRSDDSEPENGIAELYHIGPEGLLPVAQAPMSRPAPQIKRTIAGKLQGGSSAVYVASDVDGEAIVTDIFTLNGRGFRNISLGSETGAAVHTLRNHYVYGEDIDGDGILELPRLIEAQAARSDDTDQQYVIRWYSVSPDGTTTDKLLTYHNYAGGWYLILDEALSQNLTVRQQGNGYSFYTQQEEEPACLFNVYVLNGQKREDQATADNRFVLLRTESTVYAANLEVASAAYDISKDKLVSGFCLIGPKWAAGET